MTIQASMNTNDHRTNPGPLSGIRVIDLSSVVLGPLATQILADLGADVIKVESPAGDIIRSNGVSQKKGMGSIYLALNRNKRSVVLDLKSDEDKTTFLELVKTADVLVHNMRVKAIDKLGLGYAVVKEINPGIIYCAATGFGQDGPWKDKPAFDDIIQASSGFVGVSSQGKDVPEYSPNLIADKTVGLYVSNAITAGLLYRERSGEGQYIEVPMLETMTSFVLAEHMAGLTYPGSTEPAGYKRITSGGRRPYKTSNGWICLLPYTEKHWRSFFAIAGKEVLFEKFEIADRHKRNLKIQEIYAAVADIVQTKTTEQWVDICNEIDIPVTQIYRLDELLEHPHLKKVDFFQEVEHPSVGRIRQARSPFKFSSTPVTYYRHAPEQGENTQEVLGEIGLNPGDAS